MLSYGTCIVEMIFNTSLTLKYVTMKTLIITTVTTLVLGALIIIADLILVIWHVEVRTKEIVLTGLVVLTIGIIQLIIAAALSDSKSNFK